MSFEDLKSYFVNNYREFITSQTTKFDKDLAILDENNLPVFKKIKVLCCLQEDNSIQCKLSISNYGNIEIYYYKNYLLDSNKNIQISLFGSIDDIIATAASTILKKFIQKYNKSNFIIKMIFENSLFSNYYISFEDSYMFNRNSSQNSCILGDDNTTHIECPVCMSKYSDVNLSTQKIKLDCNHSICRNCFIGIISTTKECPYCRSPILNEDQNNSFHNTLDDIGLSDDNNDNNDNSDSDNSDNEMITHNQDLLVLN